jgi:hypothetical protein
VRVLAMLRVLLPSWRFFDEVEGSPTLMLRSGAVTGELGPWQAVSLGAPRGPASLFINPRGNLALAHHTLLEHLLDDVAELDDQLDHRLDGAAAAEAVEQLVSYQLVVRLAKARLGGDGPRRFQFKLTVVREAEPGAGAHEVSLTGPGQAADDLLISKLHDA